MSVSKEDKDEAHRRGKNYEKDNLGSSLQPYLAYSESERRERERRREKGRRSRSRSGSAEVNKRRGSITSSFLTSGKSQVIDEEEEIIRKKLERKLREKEESYQKRLKQWETRERKKANEYEHEREHERKRQRELQIEAQRLQEFFEDYDDNVEDPKYYRGSALHQRMKDRSIEEAADERDRQKEVEQLEIARRKLIEEGDPNAESIILQMEQKMQEHLRKRLCLNDDFNATGDEATKNGELMNDYSNGNENEVLESHTQVENNSVDSDKAGGSPEEVVNGVDKDQSQYTTGEFEPATVDESSTGISRDGSSTFLFAMSTSEPVVRKTAPVFVDEDTEDKPKKHGLSWLPPSAFKANANSSAANKPINSNEVANLPPASALSTEEKRAIIKRIIEGIPTHKRELFAYPIDWDIVDAEFVNSRIKPWVDKKIVSYIGEAEATLSSFICDQLLHHKPPERILADIAMVLDEEAEVFVVKMWRLLIYVIAEKKAGLRA